MHHVIGTRSIVLQCPERALLFLFRHCRRYRPVLWQFLRDPCGMSLWVSESGSIHECALRAQSNHYFRVGGHQTDTTKTQGPSGRHWYE